MPATEIRSLRGLTNLFDQCSAETQRHFEHLPSLLDAYPLQVALGYTFHRLELGQNMALYCGVVKVHRADSTVARNAIDSHHMTRKGFEELYEKVFDLSLPRRSKARLTYS